MLNQIKLFFEQHLALSAPEDSSEEKLQLATIVLFLEMMYMDDKVEPREQEIIQSLIQQNFSFLYNLLNSRNIFYYLGNSQKITPA